MLRAPITLLFLILAVSSQLLVPRAQASVLDEPGAGAKPLPSAPAGSSPAASSAATSSPTAQQTNSPIAPLPPNSLPPTCSQSAPVSAEESLAVHEGSFDRLASDLAKSVTSSNKTAVSIGDFLGGDGESVSPFCSRVREELTLALPKTGKFEIITRERLADLQNEKKFQASEIVVSGADESKVQVRTISGIVRGRIFCHPGELEVYAHIAQLNGGEVNEVKAVIPLREKIILNEQSIDPIKWLVENKKERPEEVILSKDVTIPLVAEGRSVGSMTKPKGMVIHIDDLTPTEIKTQISGVSLTIPVENTNLQDLAKQRFKDSLKALADQQNVSKAQEIKGPPKDPVKDQREVPKNTNASAIPSQKSNNNPNNNQSAKEILAELKKNRTDQDKAIYMRHWKKECIEKIDEIIRNIEGKLAEGKITEDRAKEMALKTK